MLYQDMDTVGFLSIETMTRLPTVFWGRVVAVTLSKRLTKTRVPNVVRPASPP